MSIPEDHKKTFRSLVEKRIKESLESLKKDRRALRLLEKEGTDPIYFVGILSNWHNEGEKNTGIEEKGTLRDVLKASEKKFCEINNRTNIDASYFVGMKVGDITEPLPAKFWSKYKKRG